jgi:hypothetical protein
MEKRTCTVPECDNKPRSGSAEWCAKHYHRWYRHGSVETTATGTPVTASRGRRYRLLELPSHPLARRAGKVWEHRVVLYDAIGAGAHPCHWCTVLVRWDATRGDSDCLMVDHLNGIGDDNRLANLVPSCSACNTSRAQQARADALRDAGWWSSHDTIASLRSGSRRERIGISDRT